jgi:alpha-L-fucosidase
MSGAACIWTAPFFLICIRMKQFFYILLILVVAGCVQKQVPVESNRLLILPGTHPDTIAKMAAHVVPSQRQIIWQELEMTAFVHFGLNTFYDREWGTKEYRAEVFNPSALDARQWAKTIKDAGAKMMIVLAKHHDGFCYWPSEYTDFSVKNSPWKNGKGDLVAEAAAACKEFGLKLGIYLSPWDIQSPIYGTDEYNTYFKNQLRELLKNYGEVSEVWFDGACGEGPNGKKQIYDWNGYYAVIRELSPNAVIAIMGPDVRWVGTESGYGRETEWSVVPASDNMLEQIASGSQQAETSGVFIPTDEMYQEDLGSREKLKNAKALIWFPSEVDVSIRPGWFYHEKEDSLVKSPEKLVDIYFSSVGRNSMLLMNISPDKRGLIPEKDIQHIRAMKAFLDSTFSENIAANASISSISPNKNFSTLTDDDNSTFWTTENGTTTAAIEFKFSKEQEFDCVMLQENFRKGQRVEGFEVKAEIDGKFEKIAEGTTIGFKRLLRFNPVVTNHVQFVITAARDCPEISTFGLFKMPVD